MELLFVAVYLVFLVLVGYGFRRYNNDASDYFRAGARGTWWLVGASIFMSGISSYTFVGNGAAIFQAGWSPLVIYLANTIVFLLSWLFLAAWFRQMRAVTVGEVVRERFGPVTEQFVACLFVLNSLIWAAMHLYGLSVFSQLLLDGLDRQWVILIVGCVVLAYATVGGNWAVMANDFVQSLILMPITILLAFLCLRAVGGWDGFQHLIAADPVISRDFRLVNDPGDFPQAQYGLWWLVAVFIGQMLGQINMTQGAMRYFSAKDGRAAARAALLAGCLMAVGCVIWFIPPMTGRLLFSDLILASHPEPLKAAEQAYAITSRQLLPNGLMPVMIVAMFAATVSSMDTGLNRNAALIVRDIIPAIRRRLGLRPIVRTGEVFVSRLVTVAMGAAVILLALFYARLQGTDIFMIALNVVTTLIIPTSVPMLFAFLIRRTAPWAAISSILAGFVPSALAVFTRIDWTYQERTFYITAAAVAGFLVAIPFYRGSDTGYRARADGFFRKMRTPVDFAREVGVSMDAIQLRLIGRYALALGAFLMLIILVPNPLWGRLSVLFVSGSVLLVGAMLLRAGRRAG
jgi:Na+/proline symporter